MMCLCIAVANLHGQTPTVPDSSQEEVWYGNLPNPDSLDISIDYVKHLSRGWFPQPYRTYSLGYRSTSSLYQYDDMPPLRSSVFHPTKYAFGTDDPFEGDEDEIKKSNSNETMDDDFPGEGYSSMGIGYDYNTSFSFVLRASLCYDISRSRLFSVDGTRSFLALNGAPQPFKEVNVLFINQHFLSLSLGTLVPVYGIFVETEALNLSSYYYLYGGLSASGRVLSEMTQYTQIADAKDRLRFANGQDTVTTLYKTPVRSGNTFRFYYDVGLGWKFAYKGILFFDVQAFASMPFNSVLKDADWKQYRFGLRFGIGYER